MASVCRRTFFILLILIIYFLYVHMHQLIEFLNKLTTTRAHWKIHKKTGSKPYNNGKDKRKNLSFKKRD